jgi:hypothetical protein
MTVTLDNLVTATQVELEQANKDQERAKLTIRQILEKGRNEGRPRPTELEQREIDKSFQLITEREEDKKGITWRLDAAKKAQRLEYDIEVMTRETSPTGAAGSGADSVDDYAARNGNRSLRQPVATIGEEPRTYHPGIDRKGKLFLRDVVAQFARRGDFEAEQRLANHMREERALRGGQWSERANVGTSNFSGLVVPQYLTDLYAPAVAALRPFADVCNSHDLPETGMTVNISRITTSTAVGIQTEGNAAATADIDDTLLTENVQTAAGYVDLTRQALERGTGVEDVTMDDLFRRYATAFDATLITQATTGLSAVAGTTTYDDVSPTVPELWPKFLGAAANAEGALLGMAFPDFVVMHSRRWYWMQAALSSQFPFIGQTGLPTQVGGQNNTGVGYNQGVRGILPNGMRVVVDNNIATNGGAGTNQDEIYIVASAECHLWEDPNAPVFIRAEQPLAHQLAVRLVLYGYFAYSFRRYTAGQQKIAGTGLVSPSF